MTKIEMFKRQFESIKSNCEITCNEYEIFILTQAKEIAHQYFLNEEIDSADEMLASIAEDAINNLIIRHRDEY